MEKQMAEIRAMRAKQYEEQMKKEAAQGKALEEEILEEGAGTVWCSMEGVVGPDTIGTDEVQMVKGDARNFYLDQAVTVMRNRKTGMIIEMLHTSEGWLNFCSMEGAPITLMSSRGDMLEANRWYVPGIIQTMKNSPVSVSSMKPSGLKAGFWKVAVEGRTLRLTNISLKNKSFILTEDGMYYLNEDLREAIHVSLSSEPERMPLADALTLLKAA